MIVNKSVERTGWFFNFFKLNDSQLKAMQELGYRKTILPDPGAVFDKKLWVYPWFFRTTHLWKSYRRVLLNKSSANTRWPVPRTLLMKFENLNPRSLI